MDFSKEKPPSWTWDIGGDREAPELDTPEQKASRKSGGEADVGYRYTFCNILKISR